MALFPIVGGVLDAMGSRFVFVLLAGALGGAVVMLQLLYLDWKRLGGDEGYEAPTRVAEDGAFEVVT
jgi:hypothetical protein